MKIDAEIERIAAQRDALLRAQTLTISWSRRERLNTMLAEMYPVETALYRVSAERDRCLESAQEIPTSVRLVLANRVRLLTCANREAPSRQWFVVEARFRRPLVAAMAAIILVAALSLLEWQPLSPRGAASSQVVHPTAAAPLGRAPDAVAKSPRRTLFGAPSDDYLSLQVTRVQLAALQSSFGVERSIVSNTYESDRTLPLDLPLRQISLDSKSAVTPR